MISLETSLEKYRYVKEYSEENVLSEKDFENILQKVWEVTPSKNNFMPYNVYVIGPSDQDLKHQVYNKCVKNEGKVDNVLNVEEVRYSKEKPRYWNIVSSSYLLIFTLRIEDQPNSFQQSGIDRGITYEAMNQKNVTGAAHNAKIEIGMFSAALADLCFKNNLDISHILNFPSKAESWNDPEFNFINRQVLLIMTVGKGKSFRRDIIPNNIDLKPDFKRIVKIL